MGLKDLLNDILYAIQPIEFAENKLHITLDAWQKDALKETKKNLILNCSRQAGKSTVSSILALHTAIYHPNSLILLVSPSLRQSKELFKKIDAALKSLNMEIKMVEDNQLSFELPNRSRVISLPGKEDTLRGYSATTLVIIDEASRVSDVVYKSLRPMLAVSGGRIVLLSTPWGKRGFFYDSWTQGGSQWHKIQITAMDIERIPVEFLKEEREALGEFFYNQEYCCLFQDTEDQLFTTEIIMQAISSDIIPLEF